MANAPQDDMAYGHIVDANKMVPSPQDDLTAERAAYIYAKLGRGSMPDIRTIGDALKTARQEALREGKDLKCRLRELVDACNDEMESGRGHTVSLNVRIKVGNAQRLLDRLASEGG